MAIQTISTFVSYCHADEKTVDRLLKLLQMRLDVAKKYRFLNWQDRKILAGEDWANEIDAAMKQSHLGLLFVSYPFLNSNFIVQKELPHFLSENLGARPLPIGLSRVPFDGSIELFGLGERQFFLGQGGAYFDELDVQQQNRFVDQLFREILEICSKYFT